MMAANLDTVGQRSAPGKHNVLREGMAADMLEPAGVYFGTTGGTLYASSDGGAHWRPITEGLPRIQSVEVSLVT